MARSMSALRLVKPDESTREMKRATLLDRLAATSIRAGEVLGGTQYRIERWLGERAISSSYEAVHVGTQRRCELEILRPDYSEHRMAVGALLRDVKAARLVAPNGVVGADRSLWLPDGRLVLVGEWHGGRTLRGELQRGAIEPSRALDLLRQCCNVLAALHRAGLVHRDLSPDNILLVRGAGRHDEIRVRGLGMQRLAGTPVGWALYVAPETVAGIDGGPGADQYALGCVAYEMLTGRPPFVGDDEIEAALAHLELPPEPLTEVAPNVPDGVGEAIHRCLSKEPEKRFESIVELEAALRQARIAADLHAPRGTLEAWWVRVAVVVGLGLLVAGAARHWPRVDAADLEATAAATE